MYWNSGSTESAPLPLAPHDLLASCLRHRYIEHPVVNDMRLRGVLRETCQANASRRRRDEAFGYIWSTSNKEDPVVDDWLDEGQSVSESDSIVVMFAGLLSGVVTRASVLHTMFTRAPRMAPLLQPPQGCAVYLMQSSVDWPCPSVPRSSHHRHAFDHAWITGPKSFAWAVSLGVIYMSR